MFRHELSPFLTEVLDAVAARPRGVALDSAGAPEVEDVLAIARSLHSDPTDVDQALRGLQASHCLLERAIEFEGVMPMVWWVVHPQCTCRTRRPEDVGSTDEHEAP